MSSDDFRDRPGRGGRALPLNFDDFRVNLDALVRNPTVMLNGSTYRSVLERALARITNQDHWIQFAFARDAQGHTVGANSSTATRWDVLGAVACESNELAFIPPPLLRFLEEMLRYLHGETFATVGEMNDYLGHEAILQFLKECIARFDS